MATPHSKGVVLRKRGTGQDTETAARARVAELYDRFDTVSVSFSGGKDSTVVLHLALDEARKRGRLPLDVFFWDEECIPPETAEYMRRVIRDHPDVNLRWLCLPCRHRNGCSKSSPYWYPWDPECPEKWVRPLPPEAITALPGFWRGLPIPNAHDVLFTPDQGTVAVILGIRAQESLMRYLSVARRVADNWITPVNSLYRPDQQTPSTSKYISYARPIYDWTTKDVWTAPKRFGWDYNRTYDLMMKAGFNAHAQRIGPPFGEQPMQSLWHFQVCWPELWAKMTDRVPGARTAARYAKTALYAFGELPKKPPDVTWPDFIRHHLSKFPAKERGMVAQRIKSEIDAHNGKTNFAPIPVDDPHPVSLLRWKYLLHIAVRGDFKNRSRRQEKGGARRGDEEE